MSFGRKGGVVLRDLTATDVWANRCGVLVTGTEHSNDGPVVGAIGVPPDGRMRDQVLSRPFGMREGRGAGLVRTKAGTVFAGTVSPFPRAGTFAIAAYRPAVLLPHCPR